MTQKGPEIPYLRVNERVKDWRKLYTAATAGLSEEQQRAFLPLYVGKKGRPEGEQVIAEIAAQKTSLKSALDELEALIDGPPSRMDLFNNVLEMKPTTSDFSGLTSFFFTLKREGERAGISYDLVMMRFLNFVRNGRKFFDEKRDKIMANMSEEELVELFKEVQTKLKPVSEKTNTKMDFSLKEEPKEEDYVFDVDDDVKEEEIPSWAKALQQGLEDLSGRMDANQPEAFYYSNYSNNRATGSRTNTTSTKTQCYSCLGFNHIAKNCRTICKNCNKVGHGESKCPKTKMNQNQKSKHYNSKSM